MPNSEADENLWSGPSAIAAAVNNFLDSLTLIEALAQIRNPHTKSVTANKRRLAKSAINRTMETAGSLVNFASLKGDPILSAKFSLSPSMLARSWDPVISATARSVYDLAHELIAAAPSEAETCGITAERNQLLLNAIVAFSASTGSDSAPQTADSFSLEVEFRRAEEILNAGVGPLLASLKAQRESLLNAYRQAMHLAERAMKGDQPSPCFP